MSTLKQSFSWWCFANKGVAAAELLQAAARIGYDGVELIEPELWPMARDAGLTIVSIVGHTSIEAGMNRLENADRIEQELRANIDRAAAFGIPDLICFSGNRDGLSDAAGLDNCAQLLERVAPIAEQAGVTLIMELLNSKVNHRDYQCDHTEWGVALCQRVNSPAFKLLYDIYHMQIMEGDIIRTIGEHHAHIAHYHTAGNPGRGPIGDSQELNYPAIIRAIEQTGYTGFIGHEFIPSGDPVQELQAAYDLCRGA
ncbi:hydroxypyruvate isomerase family protein [Cerasicoccus fimbriatus]|uniref:hydroxypyruvate isomerase family protein n=1 Tax=Cerasicoccus fimbriatus TaxID=3014554 RepID=UPI0022B2C02E|nr:TIM barrel protein [Cerasicoccus sp. TK19100]